jgi:hypothetical protein
VIIVGVTDMSGELRAVIEHRDGTIIDGPIEPALRSKVDSVLTLHQHFTVCETVPFLSSQPGPALTHRRGQGRPLKALDGNGHITKSRGRHRRTAAYIIVRPRRRVRFRLSCADRLVDTYRK